jgi:dipeptidyl aminopeptidase/acylaminoacyl peptidase
VIGFQVFKDFFVLQVDGISIVGQLFLPDENAGYPLVCLCHGAPSGDPPEPGDGGYPALAERICREGYGVCFFNFRGAGDSGGNIDFLGWTHDLQAVIDYLWNLPKIDKSRLWLVGFSAGAAVSVYVASKDKRVAAVAACACPAHFKFFMESAGPQAIIDRYRRIGCIRDDDFPPSLEGWFDNLRQITPLNYVAGIAPRPLLLVHGSRDETVPVDHARRMYRKAGEPKKLDILDAAGHRLRREERAVSTVLDWLGTLCR